MMEIMNTAAITDFDGMITDMGLSDVVKNKVTQYSIELI